MLKIHVKSNLALVILMKLFITYFMIMSVCLLVSVSCVCLISIHMESSLGCHYPSDLSAF